MLVSEMIRRLRLSLRDEEQPYKYPTDRIYLWLQGAYMDRQLASSFWSFLHQKGRFILTEAGKEDYPSSPLKDIDPDSIYYMMPGSAVHIPIHLKDYDTWVEEQANGLVYTPSRPLYLIEMPNFDFKISPPPDRTYQIFADRWIRPSEFTGLDDAPIWESEFHEIVLLDAMKIAVALQPDSPESNVMAQQVRERLPRLERRFNARYLPAIKSPGAHL